MKFFLLVVLFGLIAVFPAFAGDIDIFIGKGDKPTRDSLAAIASDMMAELRQTGDFDFDMKKEVEDSKQNGIFLLTRSMAEDLGVRFPEPLRRYNPEGYYIRAGSRQVFYVGNSALAIQQAMFDYLEQLGFRYFLPGEAWIIRPSLSTPFVKYEKLAQPLFEFRSFANGQGYYKNKALENDFNSWAKANRLGGSFPIRVGHSYQTIVTNHLEEFRQHPEYFADNVDKTAAPATAKFNVANKALVDLVIRDAKERLDVFKRTGQYMNMISMEPSDGGGFCTSGDCKAVGSISDQVFYLTNIVAKAIQRDYPGIWVGTLAYNEHIEPTKYKLEPNVFVMVTNGFNRTGMTTNELLKLWGKKVSKLGVYEYLSVYAWDNDLPGRSNATDLEFLKKSIKGYYQSGARVYLAETNVGWVSKGLGQYIATKLLWNYKLDVDSIANDFYQKAFGEAAPVIKRLFRSWEKSTNGLISDNSLAEWLALVQQASQATNDEKIEARLDYLKTYLHYLVLYKRLKANPVMENLDEIMAFAYRSFDKSAFATVPVMTALPFYSGFKGYGLYDNREHSWMADASQLNKKQINALFDADLRSVKKIEGLRSFSYGKKFNRQLKTFSPLKTQPLNLAPSFTGETKFLLKIAKRSQENYIELKSGYAARPADAKTVSVKIYRQSQFAALKEEADVVFKAEQSIKMVTEKISLQSLNAGDYILIIDDQSKMFSIKFSPVLYYSVIMDAEKTLLTSSVTGLNTFYFSVLPGIKKFVVHKSKVLKLLAPSGRVLEFTENKQQSLVVDVKDNEKGLWQVFGQAGNLFIEGVPPYLGIVPDRMLLPDDAENE